MHTRSSTERYVRLQKIFKDFGEMGVVCSIVSVKYRLNNKGITCMLLYYKHNHMGSTYHMLNLYTKHIVLSRDIIWLNKTQGEYVLRREHIKADRYIIKYEDNSNKWDHVKLIQSRLKTSILKNVKNE